MKAQANTRLASLLTLSIIASTALSQSDQILSWDDPNDNGVVDEFEIHYRKVSVTGEPENDWVVVYTSETSAQIIAPDPGAIYEVKVFAKSEDNISESSELITFRSSSGCM